MNTKILKSLALGISLLLMGGCKEFLDAKPDQRLVVPQNLQGL
ncbi:hypothetical protein [Pedobacter alpinus]|uniref:RagB/SusD family nutrient uptake outer membrane protein n=1 Tax=Pedobacter alpinus TaxID=1590643 RepID=A0ABW5TUK9_9SPHI